jgi:hypothetical protein
VAPRFSSLSSEEKCAIRLIRFPICPREGTKRHSTGSIFFSETLHRGCPSCARTNGRYVVSRGPCIFLTTQISTPVRWPDLSSPIPSPLSLSSSRHRGACDSPPHLELTCLTARGCSPATSTVGGAGARQTGGAHRLLAARQAAGGAR